MAGDILLWPARDTTSMTAYLLAMYGVVGINSTPVNLLCKPLALQETVLAV